MSPFDWTFLIIYKMPTKPKKQKKIDVIDKNILLFTKYLNMYLNEFQKKEKLKKLNNLLCYVFVHVNHIN